jgi:hypothetical protein
LRPTKAILQVAERQGHAGIAKLIRRASKDVQEVEEKGHSLLAGSGRLFVGRKVEEKGKQEIVERKEAEEASMAVSKEEASISLEASEPELDLLLADVAVHSLTAATEFNGRQGFCVDVKHTSSEPMTKRWLVQLPEGRQFWAKPENLTLICSNAACRANLLPPLFKCSQCKVAS